jgi:hypothetical protein
MFQKCTTFPILTCGVHMVRLWYGGAAGVLETLTIHIPPEHVSHTHSYVIPLLVTHSYIGQQYEITQTESRRFFPDRHILITHSLSMIISQNNHSIALKTLNIYNNAI